MNSTVCNKATPEGLHESHPASETCESLTSSVIIGAARRENVFGGRNMTPISRLSISAG